MTPARDYVVLATALWDRPWLTEHNLAAVLAQRGRVLFVEPAQSPLTPFRAGARLSPRAIADVARAARLRDGAPAVVRPVALPPVEHPRARRLSRPLMAAQLRRATRRAGLRDPVVLAARGIADEGVAVGGRPRVMLVKDWLPGAGALLGRPEDDLAATLRRDLAAADLVLATSQALVDRLAADGVEAQLLPHGFHAELAPLYDGARTPPDLEALPAPRLGYAGRIDGRLDFVALADLARRMPSASLVLVGPVMPRVEPADLAQLQALPNVHLLGPRARDELPAYVASFDCVLLPYSDSEWARHGSPLKLWDALFAGPPVVGSGYTSLRDYPPPLAHFAEGDLADAVARALATPKAGREERRRLALENSWAKRADALEALVSAATAR